MIGLFLIFCGLFLLLALLSFDANDPSINYVKSGATAAHNKAGLFGAYAAGLLDDFFGIGSLLWPCILIVLGAAHVASSITLHWWRWTGFFLLTLCLLVVSSALDFSIGDLAGGGMVGQTILANSVRYLSPFGTFLLFFFIFLAGLQLAANFSWLGLIQLCKERLGNWWRERSKSPESPGHAALGIADKARALGTTAGSRAKDVLGNYKNVLARKWTETVTQVKGRLSTVIQKKPLLVNKEEPLCSSADVGVEVGEENVSTGPVMPSEVPAVAVNLQELATGQEEKVPEEALELPRGVETLRESGVEEIAQPEPLPAPEIIRSPEVVPFTPQIKPQIKLFNEGHEVQLPGPELLVPAVSASPAAIQDLEAKGHALMTCFNDFGIQGELARITPGPVVTMFEVRPAAGVRVSRIANLADDLSLALKAVAVRIQAPIPGSDTVGIEIPNDVRQTVNFRELVECEDFQRGNAALGMILGKNIAGFPFMADLTRMPHMLVAGATGAGKSVCLNSILVSLLYRVKPQYMKLLLVDPKRIELAVYADLPHLVHPVVTEMEDAKNALDWAVRDMENRYKIFERLGVRNIMAYHQKLAAFGDNPPPEFEGMEHMPYLVIVIDELADLMMTAAREVETSIVRLAQLARAAGIHMILATQRPSVDVVTGLIKANFPCRISFQVSSSQDSRTILGQVGAEHLLGRGDMLFKPSGGKLIRLHGPFLSDDEVQRVVSHWKTQMPTDYQVDFSQWSNEGKTGGGPGGCDNSVDPLYQEAREFVLQQGQASISSLQRHLKIGFNRAARMVEQFEREGILGPPDGSKPRSVIR